MSPTFLTSESGVAQVQEARAQLDPDGPEVTPAEPQDQISRLLDD